MPTVREMYERSIQKNREAWLASTGDAAPQKTNNVRHDATSPAALPDSDDGARFDAIAASCRQKLEAARARNADWRSAWVASTGDHVPTFAEVAGK